MGFSRENSTRAAVGISRFSPSKVLRKSRSHRLWRRAGRNHDFGGSLYYLAREYRTTGDFDPWNERTGRLGLGKNYARICPRLDRHAGDSAAAAILGR